MKVFIFDNGLQLNNYVNAVKNSGHSPILTKNVNLIKNANALLLTGGKHVHPLLFRNSFLKYDNIDLITDVCELYLIEYAVNNKLPIIGVCKGLQILNVYFGGTLNFTKTHYDNNGDIYHKVYSKTPFFSSLLGKSFTVNSAHQMKINRLSSCFTKTLISSDGVIEGITHKFLPINAFQFHPERLEKEFYVKLFKAIL